ncbi:hypothetical protein WR25_11347 isoform A [Diploscapter pachys]|uniref:Tripeptidyl-peptidase 2 n=2 Tax=Diploscapter pachys TaxID=2018661 RepID=A0A2A2LHY8_9BILA|nr:hypothetical protein WR25_11347 isoform A [Diploscapter pachys]
MASFKSSGQYAKLTAYDSATYTFRIDPSGNRVEIAVANGSHGSHVAGIAAAHYPDEPKRNGLAPGAKIVAMIIGDNRIDSMETGTGLTRAINICAEMNVDVINMSYGEGTHLYNTGAIINEMQKIVEKKKAIFLISAGNNGPALSTVGAPGGTTTGIIGVGALLTPCMADPLYGVFNPAECNLYSWSSRGPCPDGWLGVSLCAPGAAFAGVPQCERQSLQMMNGTSMSSPNCAGAVASLLSGLKARNIAWTPIIIRTALENTAKKLENSDTFSCGQGLVQIKNAFDYLQKHPSFLPETFCRFNVRVSQTNISKRGVYLREATETSSKQEFNVAIRPVFEELSDHSHQFSFERHFHLKTTVPWIKMPATFVSVAQERTFFMTVDPTMLPEGSVHYAEVVGIDDANPELGPLFRVPVTVIRPEAMTKDNDFTANYKFDAPSGIPVRKFLATPNEASCAEITVKNLSKEHLDRFVLHCVHLEEHKSFRNSEAYKTLGPDGSEWKKWIRVAPGRTLEVCLTRSWTREKHTNVEMEVRFHGTQKPTELNIVHGAGPAQFRISSAPFRPVDVTPSISLSYLVVPHKPASSKTEPLTARDLFTVSGEPKQVFQIINTYNLKVTKTCEVRLEVSGISPYLYESPIDSLFMQIFSTSKEYVSAASSFPDRYTHKLEKGDYVVKVQMRSANEAVLSKFADSPLLVQMKLDSAVSVSVHSDLASAISGSSGFKWSSKSLQPSQQIALYASCVSEDKFPKNIAPVGGAYFVGKMTVMDDAEAKKVDTCPVTYHIPEFSTRPSKALSMVVLKEKKKFTEQTTEMEEAIRDVQISWLEKLKDPVAAEGLYVELIGKHPTHLPLLTTKLKILMNNRKMNSNERKTMMLIIEQILEICNPNEVLQYLGAKQENSEDLTCLKKQMDERKGAIIDALIAKTNALLDTHLKTSTEDVPRILRQGIEAILEEKKDETKDGDKKKEKEGEKDAQAQLPVDGKEETPSSEEEQTAMVSRKEVDDAYTELLKWIGTDDPKVGIFEFIFSQKMSRTIMNSYFQEFLLIVQPDPLNILIIQLSS